MDNFKYYVMFVDHHTKYIWFYPLKAKSEVKKVLIRFKTIIENHFGHKIKILYSDNGGEFIALASFLATNGIFHHIHPIITVSLNVVTDIL